MASAAPDADAPRDYRWLVGPEAAQALRDLASLPSTPNLAQRLRKGFSANRARLLLEQADLRRRAKAKFANHEQMFFTPVGLEQSTDEWVAAYKSRRFAAGARVADLCCGIGGDLLSLARRGPALGCDLNPVAIVLAEANLRTLAASHPSAGVQTTNSPAEEIALGDFAAWHIDPDRRASGRRVTTLASCQPGLPVLRNLLLSNPHGALKLAPATTPPEDWRQRAQCEWISRLGQCRQLALWFGSLAKFPGRHVATILRGEAVRQLAGLPLPAPRQPRLGRYLYEPDPAVLAATLSGALAKEHGLWEFEPGVAYLTGDARIDGDTALSAFEIQDVLPYKPKRLKAMFRERGVSRLEVKKRGVDIDPDALRRRLSASGDSSATLLVTRRGPGIVAIVAQRLA